MGRLWIGLLSVFFSIRLSIQDAGKRQISPFNLSKTLQPASSAMQTPTPKQTPLSSMLEEEE